MNGVKITAYYTSVTAGGQSVYNTRTGGTTYTPGKLTKSQITEFKKNIQKYKTKAAEQMMFYLNRGGFYYGADLWRWTVKQRTDQIALLVNLTFEDTYNEGKVLFMKRIYKMGLLDREAYIVKPYGII